MDELEKDNDLFYVCSLIEYIARKTKNTKKFIVDTISKDGLKKIYELASIYHCENIDKISDELIDEFNIEKGTYDITADVQGNIPSYWDVGKVYQRLIIMNCNSNQQYFDKMIEVLKSWIIEKIDNYNSSMYYENPGYLFECYKVGKVL